MRGHAVLIVAFLGAFVVGTSEFLLMGILRELASDTQVSVVAAGQLVGAFAVGIAVGGPLIVVATRRLDRKLVLVTALIGFGALNLGFTIPCGFWARFSIRLVSGALGGAYYAVASTALARLARAGHGGRALSVLFGGIATATIVGSPAGTYLAHHFGWAAPYRIVAIVAGLLGGAVFALLPRMAPEGRNSPARSLRDSHTKALRLALACNFFCTVSFFALYSFLTPYLGFVAHVSDTALPRVLAVCGVAGLAGNLAAGWATDFASSATWKTSIAMMAAAAFAMAGLASHGTTVIFLAPLWCMGAWGAAPCVQARVVMLAPQPDIASAINISCTNFGIAVGAIAGGAVVHYLGFNWLGLVAGIFGTLGLTLAHLSLRQTGRDG